MADTGWFYLTSVYNVDYGKNNWSNVNNSKVEDGYYASNQVGKNTFSNCLGFNDYHYYERYGSNYIPYGSFINGIELKIKRYASSSDIEDKTIKVNFSTSSLSQNKADAGVGWPTSNTWSDIYGSPTDMWGHDPYRLRDLDPSDDHIFIEITVLNTSTSNSRNAYIDSVLLKIYFSVNTNMFGMNF